MDRRQRGDRAEAHVEAERRGRQERGVRARVTDVGHACPGDPEAGGNSPQPRTLVARSHAPDPAAGFELRTEHRGDTETPNQPFDGEPPGRTVSGHLPPGEVVLPARSDWK